MLDEPTSGLDARAAAIVMRAVKNVANSNRTVICVVSVGWLTELTAAPEP